VSDGEANEFFGRSGSMSEDGTTVLIGASSENENGFGAGAAYLFRYEEGAWVEVAKLIALDGTTGDFFGRAVSLDGDLALVGAPRSSEEPGLAYLFAGARGVDCNDNGVPDACDILGRSSVDQESNGVPDECQGQGAPGDANGDGGIDVDDLIEVILGWGDCAPWPSPCPADMDGSGTVAMDDLLLVIEHWGG
jgi:hypothetical protein